MKSILDDLNSAEINKEEVKLLLSDWHRRAKQSQRVQYNSGNYYAKFNYILGIPSIILSTVVGTAIFASLEKEASLYLKIVTGTISILTATLASLQTFLRYSEKSEKYRVHSAKYGAVRRDIELLITFLPTDKEELLRALSDIKGRMDELAEESQEISARIKKKSVEELESQPRKNELFKKFDIPTNNPPQNTNG